MDTQTSHSHCNTCIKINKCIHNQNCAIVACELNCGFRFHACKMAEHRLLCANEKVACINAGNGCPVMLIRYQRAQHLETCPASVVICTMEWNRWPICSQDRQMHVPFHVPNPRAKEGQLDIALALRDQRMLNEWMKVPHRTRRVLRNSLTKCFPAVPLHSGSSNEGESPVVSDDDNLWECKKAPPGLESSVCSELYKSSRETKHCETKVASVLNGKNVILNDNQCSTVYFNNTKLGDIFCSNSIIPPPPSSPPMIVSLGLDLTLESITRYQTKPKNMYTFLCAQEFRRDEYSWHYKNVHSDIHGGLNGWLEHRCPLAHYGCMYSLRRFYPIMKGATVIHNDTLESFGVRPYVPYDISQLKKSAWNSNTRLLQPLLLCELPFEVLRHICRFLDSFSLCNLALTCRRLREVCCSLLEERGLVVLQWRRRLTGSKVTWSITHKRWFFSTAFTPVKEWGFEAGEHMSNHLRSCICFERNVDSKPYFHIFGCEPDPSLHAKLTASRNVGDTSTSKVPKKQQQENFQ